MHTTLDIDDDVLEAIEKLAIQRGTTAGGILSDLAQRELRMLAKESPTVRNGFELLPVGGKPVTVALIENLLNDEGQP